MYPKFHTGDRVLVNGEALYAEILPHHRVKPRPIGRGVSVRYARELRDDLEEYHAQFKDDPIVRKYNMGLVLSKDKPALMNREDY